jgi:hypothetical protein
MIDDGPVSTPHADIPDNFREDLESCLNAGPAEFLRGAVNRDASWRNFVAHVRARHLDTRSISFGVSRWTVAVINATEDGMIGRHFLVGVGVYGTEPFERQRRLSAGLQSLVTMLAAVESLPPDPPALRSYADALRIAARLEPSGVRATYPLVQQSLALDPETPVAVLREIAEGDWASFVAKNPARGLISLEEPAFEARLRERLEELPLSAPGGMFGLGQLLLDATGRG